MFIARSVPPIALAVLVAALPGSSVWAQDANVGDNAARASISVEIRSIETYPFSDPNPVPILASDTRLYPYHRFEGYAHASEPGDVVIANNWSIWHSATGGLQADDRRVMHLSSWDGSLAPTESPPGR